MFSMSRATVDDASGAYPALTLPPDIADMWKASGGAKAPRSVKPHVTPLRVTEKDYRDLLRVPVMDADVAKRLPVTGKSDPGSFSPYWEEELRGIDARSRASIRLSSFASILSEHLGRVLARDLGADSEVFREAKLLSVLTTRILESSMALSHHTSNLRRDNACASLRGLYGSEFSDVMKRPKVEAQEFLFGSIFCRVSSHVGTLLGIVF